MIVYTGGTFDLFHAGHVAFLAKCRQLSDGGEVIVGLNTDSFIAKFKGKKPIMSYAEREACLKSCRYVTAVCKNIGNSDSKKTIAMVTKKLGKVKMVVIGSDWHAKDYLQQMGFTWEWLDKMELGLCYVPYTRGISTTLLKQRIKNY